MKKLFPVVILIAVAAAFVVIGLVSKGRTGGKLQIAVIPIDTPRSAEGRSGISCGDILERARP